MPRTLRRKPKPKSQARIYEHTENIYPLGHEESAATKEFVRQELKAELSPIRRDIKWLMFIVSSLAGLMLYLHSDTKSDMRELKADIDKRFDKIESLLQKK